MPKLRMTGLAPAIRAERKRISEARAAAVLSRWESVRLERTIWLEPFSKLSIDRAMAYLEDLRIICEQAGRIMNKRISEDKNNVRCAGPKCGKDLNGLRPDGRPLWIGKKDLRDKDNPEIIRSLYFCSQECDIRWVSKTSGAGGTTK